MTKKLCDVCNIGWFSIKVTLRSKEVVDLVKFSVFHLIFPFQSYLFNHNFMRQLLLIHAIRQRVILVVSIIVCTVRASYNKGKSQSRRFECLADKVNHFRRFGFPFAFLGVFLFFIVLKLVLLLRVCNRD